MDLIRNFRSSTSTMDEKLFDETLIIVVIVSVANIIGNLIISFPFEANYKWAFMLILSFIVNRYKFSYTWLKFGYVTLIVTVIFPIGWYQSGAGNNNVIAYVFLTIIAITFMFKDKQRLFLISLVSLLFITFMFIELKFPNFLPNNGRTIQLTDRLIQIPLAIFISFLMLKQFDNAYRENSKKLINLNHELEVFAYTDSLTGIHNRAFIFQKLNDAIVEGKSFTTVIIDIDNFKLINDNFGHIAGDHVLKSFAYLLSQHFSDDGYVARYGGDEFIMLLNIPPYAFKSEIEDFIITFKQHTLLKTYQTTFSLGYGKYHNQALDEHLKEVDKALYLAKGTGKDKIMST